MKRLWLILLALLLIVNGCGSKSDSKSTSSKVSSYKEQNEQSLNKKWKDWEGIGAISIGFETSSFEPKGIDERWWISFESDSIASIYFNETGEPKSTSYNPNIKFYKPITFRIKGIISPKGSYGHLSMYRRKIMIQGISEINK